MSLQTDLILGKGVVVTVGSGSPVSTLGHIKIDNRCRRARSRPAISLAA